MAKPLQIKTYIPRPKQIRFHADPHKFRLFGGARGPGKSRALLEDGISACNFQPDGKGGAAYRTNGTGLNAIILRTSLTDLEGSVIAKFKESDWTKAGAKYQEQKKLVTFPNGATLRFGYAANEKDLAQYLGQEYAWVGWDELGLVPSYRMWVNMMGSLRCPIPDVFCRMAGTANPGGPGHAWLKNMFVLGLPAQGMEKQQYNRADYSYIPANYLDGPYANDKEYLANLLAQPLAVQKCWIDGNWDVVAGSYFDCWVESCVLPWKTVPHQPWWKTWISIDWGFQHHFAVYWHCLDEDGNVYTFKEYVDRKIGSRLVAQNICDYSKGLKIDTIYISPDADGKRDEVHSIKQQMDEVFVENGLVSSTPAATGPNSRPSGWLLMYQLLKSGEWKIADHCKEAVAAMPTLMINPAKPEDVLKVDTVADDVGDALRYGIYSQLQGRVSKKPDAVAKAEHLAKQPSIQARYMADLKWQEMKAKERSKMRQIGKIPNWKSKLGR
jgi:hypothetical protein